MIDHFGVKSHSSALVQRFTGTGHVERRCMFSSVAVVMGQGGAPLYGAASAILDSQVWLARSQCIDEGCTTILWGPIAAIGMRRKLYGSRDVFEEVDRRGLESLTRCHIQSAMQLRAPVADKLAQYKALLAQRRVFSSTPAESSPRLTRGCRHGLCSGMPC